MDEQPRSGTHERAWGYEIRSSDRGLVLTDRRTWGLAYAGLLVGGFGLALLVGGLVVLGTSGGLDVAVGAPVVLGLGAFLLASSGALYLVYRQRGDRAPDDAPGTLVVDLHEGALKDRSGQMVARLADVRMVVHRDFVWSRGIASVIVLSWPRGRRVVFRSASPAKIARVLRTLAGAGL